LAASVRDRLLRPGFFARPLFVVSRMHDTRAHDGGFDMRVARADVAIIGAGTAGLAAYHAARAAGATAMLIEGGTHGTTCARVGCMPSKLLIAAANAAHAVETAPGFGVHHDGVVRIDDRAVMARVRRERDRFVDLVLRDVERIPGMNRLRGHARFVDDHTLDVGGHTCVISKTAVIATGSRPSRAGSFDALGDRVIVSDDVFDWQDLPKSVAVIGLGIVGLELGQALHRLGVRVAILGLGGRVGPISDPEILACSIAAFKQELTLEPDARISDMRRDGDRVAISRTMPNGAKQVETFDYVLVSTGRTPNIQGIGLEKTSIQLDAKGVPRNDPATAQTLNADGNGCVGSPIFIAGDASNSIPLLHEAADEGRIAGENAARVALGKPAKAGLRRAPIGVVFTDPQICIVGGGFGSLQPGSFATGRVNFEDQGRARILLRNKGRLNVYAETATGRFRGAEMFAPEGEHLAHLLAWALQNGMLVEQMLEMPYYHPVLEEGLRTALHDVNTKVLTARRAGSEAAFRVEETQSALIAQNPDSDAAPIALRVTSQLAREIL
jgi:dihydrolipoamide dehydrogenase